MLQVRATGLFNSTTGRTGIVTVTTIHRTVPVRVIEGDTSQAIRRAVLNI